MEKHVRVGYRAWLGIDEKPRIYDNLIHGHKSIEYLSTERPK